MSLVNTINREKDYNDLENLIPLLKKQVKSLTDKGIRIDIPVEERYWEYASALLSLESVDGECKNILCVGAGYDPLGPILSKTYHVTECEPNIDFHRERNVLNNFLLSEGKSPIKLLPNPIEALPDEKYDAVFCISVIEHINGELAGWVKLSDRVREGGVLFITTDCVPDRSKSYTFDNLRATNYDLEMLKSRVDMICSRGFVTIGKPDYTYNGSFVYDYTFFRAGFLKRVIGEQNEESVDNRKPRTRR